jgi:hypothetical protein
MESVPMMTWLSAGLSAIVGKYAATLTLPACLFGLLLLGHQFMRERESRQQAQATNICNAAWESQVRRQERDAARQEAVAAQELLAGERTINEGLNNDLQKLRFQVEAASAAAAGPSSGHDPRCLSDSVLDLIGGRDGTKRGPPASRGGASQSSPAAGAKAP